MMPTPFRSSHSLVIPPGYAGVRCHSFPLWRSVRWNCRTANVRNAQNLSWMRASLSSTTIPSRRSSQMRPAANFGDAERARRPSSIHPFIFIRLHPRLHHFISIHGSLCAFASYLAIWKNNNSTIQLDDVTCSFARFLGNEHVFCTSEQSIAVVTSVWPSSSMTVCMYVVGESVWQWKFALQKRIWSTCWINFRTTRSCVWLKSWH